MNVVYAMTHHVYEWILPSIRSLSDSNPDAKVFILAEHDTLPFDLPMDAEVINISDQPWFPETGANYNNQYKYINLLKVRYPSILPVNKVIHLDIDTIICDRLDGLWNTDLTGKWVGAVPEYWGHYKPFGDTYYNMGVAVINLEQMRLDGVEKEMEWYLNSVRQPYADQDAWHKYGLEKDKFVTVDVRFNESAMTGVTNRPAIVHYCGVGDWFTSQDMCRKEYRDFYQ